MLKGWRNTVKHSLNKLPEVLLISSCQRTTRDPRMVTYRRAEGHSHLLEDPCRASNAAVEVQQASGLLSGHRATWSQI